MKEEKNNGIHHVCKYIKYTKNAETEWVSDIRGEQVSQNIITRRIHGRSV